jgi:hypothetical protein
VNRADQRLRLRNKNINKNKNTQVKKTKPSKPSKTAKIAKVPPKQPKKRILTANARRTKNYTPLSHTLPTAALNVQPAVSSTAVVRSPSKNLSRSGSNKIPSNNIII